MQLPARPILQLPKLQRSLDRPAASWLRAASPRRRLKPVMLGLGLAGSLFIGGCGGVDGVELNGGIFDALGLSGSGEKVSNKDLKVAARPGLVLPPEQTNLPQPQTGNPFAEAESWPVDPEDRKAGAKAALAKKHAEYCEVALRNARLKGETGVVTGPQGNCQPGLFGSLLGQVEGNK